MQKIHLECSNLSTCQADKLSSSVSRHTHLDELEVNITQTGEVLQLQNERLRMQSVSEIFLTILAGVNPDALRKVCKYYVLEDNTLISIYD